MITTTDLANKQIAANGTPTLVAIIKELIEEHDIISMREGINYFNNKNDIIDRVIYYWKDGAKVEDETSPNNRVPNNYHKILVMQKMGYLVGKPITFSDKESEEDEEGNINSPNEELVTEINTILDETWDDTVNELIKGASNKGVEWLQPYIEEADQGIGDFKYAVIDAREVIPIWETSKLQALDSVLRYYTVWVNKKERYRAEWWTKDTVTYYIQDENGEFILDDEGNEVTESEDKVFINPSSHYYFNGVGYGWGAVPFIPFKNNEELSTDLQDYKELIDIYDKV
ncbi:MAG: phage portal protein, partial [Firmicutes bacterium]|nr:phage portal protein [Bacillota bacterium]